MVLVAIFAAACARTSEKNAYVLEDAKDGSGVVIAGYRGAKKDLVIPATIEESPSWKSDFRRSFRVVF